MVAAELMGSVYWRLLRKLERQQFNVFGPKPTRLNKGQKLLLDPPHRACASPPARCRPTMARPEPARRLIVNADDFGRSALDQPGRHPRASRGHSDHRQPDGE